jgi:aspartate oxidase
MANTYTWKVANLERNVADGKVFNVHYTVSAVSDQVNPNSENGGFYSAGAYGSVGLDGDVTVEFDSLTEEVVVGWVKEALGGDEKVTEIQTALDNQIAEQQTPTKASGLPW